MEELLKNIRIQVSDQLFNQDPDSKLLGKKIVRYSIDLIDEIGFEAFTFKKLGEKIGSPESTIYRYFRNKKQLLMYLTSWYWTWLECRLVFLTNNIVSPHERLSRAITVVTQSINQHSDYTYINEVKLNKIIISESFKAFLNKEADEANRLGYYQVYNRIVERISDMVLEVSPKFQYPHTLVSTVIEGAHFQKFFSNNIPLLTDVGKDETKLVNFFTTMVFRMIKNDDEK